MTRKKVLLLNPCVPQKLEVFNIPMGCMCIGSYIFHHGYDVEILDENNAANKKDFYRLVKNSLNNIICAGLSVMSAQIPAALALARFIRQTAPDIPIAWGGTHPTLYPASTVESGFADVVVRGEGEETFLALLEAFSGKKEIRNIPGIAVYDRDAKKTILTDERPFIDINELPPIEWHLLHDLRTVKNLGDAEKRTVAGIPLQTSRGCPHRCVFCVNSVLKERYRSRRVDLVIRDMESIAGMGAKRIFFIDEMFFMQKKRAEEILDEIISRKIPCTWYASLRSDFIRRTGADDDFFLKIRAAGCAITGIGAESGSDRILGFLQKDITAADIIATAKHLRKAGITGHFSFMIGLPGETGEDVRKTVRLIIRLYKINPDMKILGPQVYRPYPGSSLYQQCIAMGMNEPETLSDWAESPYIEGDLTAKELVHFPWISFPLKHLHNIVFYVSRLNRQFRFPVISFIVRRIFMARCILFFFLFPFERLVYDAAKLIKRVFFPGKKK